MVLPANVVVYGGGRQGANIAHTFLAAGARVTVVETNDDVARMARANVRRSLARSAASGHLPQALDATLARLAVTLRLEDVADADLIVDSRPDEVAARRPILAIGESAAPKAILATSSHSSPVRATSPHLSQPSRLLGLRFLGPAHSSRVVEVVAGTETDPRLVQIAHGWMRELGKEVISVADSPASVSSRLRLSVALEAMRIVEEGVATPAEIDTAMVVGCRYPFGPLRMSDTVGLDVQLTLAETLASEIHERFEPPRLLRALVDRGDLGRKTGAGFFRWKE